MASDAKKKIAALIVAGAPPSGKDKPEADEPASDDADEDMEAKSAAEESAFADLRMALKSGDDKAGVEAFKEFLEHCGSTKSE